jgi:hypothetical protein
MNVPMKYTLRRPFLHIHVVGKALWSACVSAAAVFCRRVGECGVSVGFEQRGIVWLLAATHQRAKYCCQWTLVYAVAIF